MGQPKCITDAENMITRIDSVLAQMAQKRDSAKTSINGVPQPTYFVFTDYERELRAYLFRLKYYILKGWNTSKIRDRQLDQELGL